MGNILNNTSFIWVTRTPYEIITSWYWPILLWTKLQVQGLRTLFYIIIHFLFNILFRHIYLIINLISFVYGRIIITNFLIAYLFIFWFAETLSCDHTKVTPYFIESINSKSGFWAVPCPNRLSYNLGLCTPARDKDYILMGEHTPHT